MIKYVSKEKLQCKCVLNMNEEGNYYVESTARQFNLKPDALIVDVESMQIRDQKVYSIEIIATGYPEEVNSYKSYIIQERELKLSYDGLIKRTNVDRMFLNRLNEYETVSTMVIEILKCINNYYTK